MGDGTGISWTDASWNPLRGCTRVSAGCMNCYAEQQAARINRQAAGLGRTGAYEGLVKLVGPTKEPRWTGVVRMVPEHLADPLRWSRPRRIFTNSMSDLFHESLSNEQIAAIFGVMASAQHHKFQCLTKRAKRMREWFEWASGEIGSLRSDVLRRMRAAAIRFLPEEDHGRLYNDVHENAADWPLPNVWLGVSVENQEAADERIPDLLRTPAAVRFLSCEPLIGAVDLDMLRCEDPNHGPSEWADDGDMPWCVECDSERSSGHWLHLDGGIDWVIAGCESGPGARPCSLDWLRALRDQCAEHGVPFFLKQAVGPSPAQWMPPDARGVSRMTLYKGEGSKQKAGRVIELPYLDDVQHAAFPGPHDRPDCPCGHDRGEQGVCGGCNCADQWT